MVDSSKNKEPVWAKYITEENLPTADLQRLCEIIGLEATKKLMFNAKGEKFLIHAYCNQPYKKQYIIDNYTATRRNIIELVKACDTTQRYVYKVIKEHVEGNRGKK